MPDWEVATALAIALIVALTTHVFYRRPPAALWPWLPMAFAAALVFAVGDLIANLWTDRADINWLGHGGGLHRADGDGGGMVGVQRAFRAHVRLCAVSKRFRVAGNRYLQRAAVALHGHESLAWAIR